VSKLNERTTGATSDGLKLQCIAIVTFPDYFWGDDIAESVQGHITQREL